MLTLYTNLAGHTYIRYREFKANVVIHLCLTPNALLPIITVCSAQDALLGRVSIAIATKLSTFTGPVGVQGKHGYISLSPNALAKILLFWLEYIEFKANVVIHGLVWTCSECPTPSFIIVVCSAQYALE